MNKCWNIQDFFSLFLFWVFLWRGGLLPSIWMCKGVRLCLYNLKPETYRSPYPPPHPPPTPFIISRGKSEPDSIWGEVVDHEGISPVGNKFDIRLEVRTQNGSVVRKSKMLLYLPFQLQFHIIAQTSFFFFWSYHIFWHFPTFLARRPFTIYQQFLVDLFKLHLMKCEPITLSKSLAAQKEKVKLWSHLPLPAFVRSTF